MDVHVKLKDRKMKAFCTDSKDNHSGVVELRDIRFAGDVASEAPLQRVFQDQMSDIYDFAVIVLKLNNSGANDWPGSTCVIPRAIFTERKLINLVGMSSIGADLDVSSLRARSSICPIALYGAPSPILEPMQGFSLQLG